MKKLFILFALLFFAYSCTSVDYDNPLDKNSTDYLGDEYLRDDNGNGIPNFRDPTSDFFLGERDSTSTDTIEHILSIQFYASSSVFNISESVPFAVKVESSVGVDRISYDFTGDGEENTEFVVANDSLVRFVYADTGSYNAVATVFDDNGESVSDTFNLRIRDRASEVDTIAPVIVLEGPDTVRVLLGGTYVEPGFSVTDDGESMPSSFVNINDSLLNLNSEGIYPIVYTVSDLSGNVGTATRFVEVYEEELIVTPVINLLGSTDTTLTQNSLWVEQGFTVEDESDADVESRVTITFVNVQGDTVADDFTQNPGIYVIYYNVVNASGVSADTRARNVTVQAVSSSSSVSSVSSSSVTSSVSSSISSSSVVSSSSSSVEDITPPVVTLVGEAEMEHLIGGVWIDPGATAIDNVDGDLSEYIESEIYSADDTNRETLIGRNFFLNTEGTYIIVYFVSDAAGNVGEAVRTVNVTTGESSSSITSSSSSVSSSSSSVSSSVGATEPPEILLLLEDRNPDTIFIGYHDSYDDPGAMAIDDVDGIITAQIVVSSDVDVNTIGEYTVTYSVTNSAELTSTVTRVVVVTEYIDRIPPTLDLTGPTFIKLHINESFVEPGFVAEDDIDGDITDQVVVTVRNSEGDLVDIETFTEIDGEYTIFYNVSDQAGNSAQEKTRDILVTSGIEVTEWDVWVTIEESAAIEVNVAAPSYYTASTAIFRCERITEGLNMPIEGSIILDSVAFPLDGWSPSPTIPLVGLGTITTNQAIRCKIGQ